MFDICFPPKSIFSGQAECYLLTRFHEGRAAPDLAALSLDLATVRGALLGGAFSPRQLLGEALRRAGAATRNEWVATVAPRFLVIIQNYDSMNRW